MENNLLNTINENDIQQTSVDTVSVGDTETGEEANYYEKNSLPQAPFDYDYSKKEHLNLSNGGMRYVEDDFTLPGKNGFDLLVKRVYNSAESCTMKFQPQKNGSILKTVAIKNLHNIKQYGLGYGWSFNLPSIETTPEPDRITGNDYNDVLHLEDGSRLEIVQDNGVLSFKDYTLTDVTIKTEEGTLTHNIRTECQTSYNIIVEYKNGSADYFKTIIENEKIDRVVLVARKDKFSNCIFFDLKKYGGMNIIDSFGRDVVLSKYGEQFIWKLPSAEGENPITIKYQTNSQNSTLESYTDAENRTTTYLYTDKDVYSAKSKCVSKQYGDDSDVKIPWLLLKEIIHPTKAKTVFYYGNGKDAVPLTLTVGEYGGFKNIFPVYKREDISGNGVFNTIRYSYILSEDGKYIEKAEVIKTTGSKEIYQFSDFESNSLLLSYNHYHNDILDNTVIYTYGEENKNKDLCIKEEKTIYAEDSSSYRVIKNIVYSENCKADIIEESVEYPDNTALSSYVRYTYGNCSIVTGKYTQYDTGKECIEEYTLDETRDNLVVAEKRIYNLAKNVKSLKEKTVYLYGEDSLLYNVIEERKYYSQNSTLDSYTSVLYEYNCGYVNLPTTTVITGVRDHSDNELENIVYQTEYDVFGRVIRKVDPMGNDTLYQYDNIGRLICEKSPILDGIRIEKSVHYNDDLNTVVYCDANGNYTRTEYTDLGYEYKIYLANGLYPQDNDILVKECCYDENCRLEKEIFYDGYGSKKENIRSEIKYIYDCFDRVVLKEIPQTDYLESYEYIPVCNMPYDQNEKGCMVRKTIHGQTDAPDIVTETYYNVAGQENAVYLSGDIQYKKKHNLVGTLTEITDALGNTTKYITDYAQRVIETKQPYDDGYANAYTIYDALGNKVAQTDFMGNTTTYVYDSANRLIKKKADFDTQITYKYGYSGLKEVIDRYSEQIYVYNPCGNVVYEATKVENGKWKYTAYSYDALSRVVKQYRNIDSAGNTTFVIKTKYDNAGNKIEVSSGKSGISTTEELHTLHYTYNRFNKVTSFTDSLGKTEYYEYSPIGLLLKHTARNGAITEYTYDAVNRVICKKATLAEENDESPVKVETVYSRNGLKLKETVIERRTSGFCVLVDFSKLVLERLAVSYIYDNKGRLIKESSPDNTVKEYSYDANGNRSVFKLFKDGAVDPEIHLCYTYDNSNRLASVASKGNVIAQYVYDANGRKTQQTTANGGVTTYVYNHAGLMTELVNKIGENTVSSFSYQYSLDGKQIAKTDKGGLTTHYSYDLIDQIISEKQTVKGTDEDGKEIDVETANISYSYDWFGNRTETVATGYPVYTKTCVYDGGNRLISESHTQDGETVTTTHSYDDNGNLMRSESSDGKVVTRNYNGFNWQTDYVSADASLWFRYLPNGLRYSKQKRTNSTCTVTTHHWDGSDIVMDVSQNGTVKGRYLRGNSKLIAEDIAGSLSYYFFNAHGDVTERVSSNGDTLKSYKYDSFGNIINPATVGDPNDPIYVDQSPFGYAGEYLDKENGEIYLRARYYSSEYGRFVTEDPAKYGTNWYSYCDNNPVTKVDRTGLRPTTDGSAGSEQAALEDMNKNYPKQQQSVPHPAPEPPKSETPKPSKPSKPTPKPPSTPSYIKQYNPDHNEFEPPFYDDTVLEEKEDNPNLSENIFENVAVDTSSAGTKKYIEKQINLFDDVLPNNVVKTALKNVDELFSFGGAFIDFAGQLVDGRDVDDALMMTGFHLAVEWAVVLATVTFLSASFSFGVATAIGVVIASVINTLIDYYLEPLF